MVNNCWALGETLGECAGLVKCFSNIVTSNTTYCVCAKGEDGNFNILAGTKESTQSTKDTAPPFAKEVCEFLDAVGEQILVAIGEKIELAASKLQSFRYYNGEHHGSRRAQLDHLPDNLPHLGCPEHIDSGILTLVLSKGSRGLQVYDQLDNDWRTVDGGGLWSAVVLVGHTLEVATGNVFRATQHRVEATLLDRISLVHKLHARSDLVLPVAGKDVRALLSAFEASRPSVDPQVNSGRLTGVAGVISVSRRSIADDTVPKCMALFNWINPPFHASFQVGLNLTARTYAETFPVLRNPHFLLWVVISRSRQLHLNMNHDLCRRILGNIPQDVERDPLMSLKGVVERIVIWAHSKLPHDRDARRYDIQPADVKIVHEGQFYDLDSHGDAPISALHVLGVATSVADLRCMIYRTRPQSAPSLPLNLRIITEDRLGNQLFFNQWPKHIALAKLMLAFCDRQGVGFKSVKFLYDGTMITEGQTANELDMVEDAFLDVRMRSA